ncbi:hypothetical protein Gohar_019130, partial [Gossypium harknessii]|nr:hypothetical protein [Gossypium harknessii]
RVTGNASTGGVICDQASNCILGYNRYLGSCTPFEAKLWGILDGILILLNKGYKWATIQTNNLGVAKALPDKGLEDSELYIGKQT